MIISASRRTDIPRFYADWFMKRIQAGFVLVPNPYNPHHIARVSLAVRDVTAIVFWTRYPGPMLTRLHELDEQGFRYYFQITLNHYPSLYEANAEPLARVLDAIQQLAHQIGPARIIWRYDPIFFSRDLDSDFHLHNFATLSHALTGCTHRVVISLLDEYRKTVHRLHDLQCGFTGDPLLREDLAALLAELARIARQNGMVMESCAEAVDLTALGIYPGRCIDDRLLREVFNLNLTFRKDPSQRPHCGCMVSKDIGINNTCPGGCVYCYAVGRPSTALNNYQRHISASDALMRLPGEIT